MKNGWWSGRLKKRAAAGLAPRATQRHINSPLSQKRRFYNDPKKDEFYTHKNISFW